MKHWSKTALIAVAALAASTVHSYAERTLRLSLQVPTNHPVGQNIVYFKDEVEKISSGEIKVELYDAAQLYKGSEVPQAVASGAIDMGLVLIDEYAATVPATGLFSVAFMFPDYESLAKAAGPDSPVRQKLDELIRQTGTRVMWWQDYGPVQLLSKEVPMITPDDMKGKKVRVLGKPSGDFINAVGGVPVKIGGSEQFLAYQRGTVDVGMTGTTAIQSRKLDETMDWVTITNHAQTEFLVVMNDATFDAMSDQEKGWMQEAALKAEEKMRAETKDENLASEKYIAENTEMKVQNLTPEQIAVWQEAAAPAVDAYIQSAGEVGKELVDQVKALR
ncbi:MAG: C4-dicarboxylate ABC transporter substrate-binding protein [Fulvimarina sp.]|nr:C4-dicarboxylate ABC transporter substrate-binding protein [Fulvimarina sp.]